MFSSYSKMIVLLRQKLYDKNYNSIETFSNANCIYCNWSNYRFDLQMILIITVHVLDNIGQCLLLLSCLSGKIVSRVIYPHTLQSQSRVAKYIAETNNCRCAYDSAIHVILFNENLFVYVVSNHVYMLRVFDVTLLGV